MPTFKTTYQDDAHITNIDVGATDIYVWVAVPWTLPSEALWSIKKIVKGSIIPILHANGDAYFNKVWDDRATYDYS